MTVQITEAAKAAIEAILKRGNDVVIRRKGDGIIVFEETKKTAYRTDQSGDR